MRPMSLMVSVLALAAASPGLAQDPHTTSSATVTIPNTPAGRALAAWLRAFNSGDRGRMEEYHKAYRPNVSIDVEMDFRKRMGGFDLVSIQRSEPRHIESLVFDRANHDEDLGELDISDTNPPRVTKNAFYRIAPNARVIGFLIDAAVRARVIRVVAAKLDRLYVIPDLGKKAALDITTRWQRGEFASDREGDTFAHQLTIDLQATTHDRHLDLQFSPAQLAANPTGQSAVLIAEQHAQLKRENCEFKRAEWLPGNIGYIQFDGFDDPRVCRDSAVAAMAFLANVDAIIFDLRENHGGIPDLVTLLESYLFASPTHLDDFWDRPSGRTKHTWTLPNVPGKRLPSVPVYILTSHRTFSGAEEFAYALQALKRATVVGEVTGGGAHAIRRVRINSRFTLALPMTRVINPITKTDWEGTGVIPDVRTPASDALTVAEKLAKKELARRRSDQEASTDSRTHVSAARE